MIECVKERREGWLKWKGEEEKCQEMGKGGILLVVVDGSEGGMDGWMETPTAPHSTHGHELIKGDHGWELSDCYII